MIKAPTLIISFLLLLSLFLLSGCTDSIPSVPSTYSTILRQVTDLNVALAREGYYDGNCLAWNGNKISVTDCNSGGGTGFVNPAIEDLDMSQFDILDVNNVYLNVIWADKNQEYGTMYCTDGNIVVGYLGGYTC